MAALSLAPMRFSAEEIGEVVELYETNPDYWRAAGEYGDGGIRAEEVEAELRAEARGEGAVLLARDAAGRLVGVVCLLERHPGDGFPWIGLLMVHGGVRRTGVGRALAGMVEERFRREGREGVRLAVLEDNAPALTFWRSLGWEEVDRRPDRARGRPCVVMHKRLALRG